MSTPEQFGEQKSSIEITQNAKGESQVRVKVYDGADQAELDRIRGIAVAAYNATRAAVR